MRSRHSSTTAAARSDLRERLKAAPDLARALARIVVGRGGPRDLAAIRDGIFAAAQIRRTAFAARGYPARSRRTRSAALRRPTPRSPPSLTARLPTSCRRSAATAASSARGYEPALDEARALRDESRRVIAALQARYAETDRHPLAENPPQQRARLFRRRHRAARREAAAPRRSTRPSSIARRWPARCASPPPSSASLKPRSPTPPTARWRSSSKFSTGSPPRSRRRARAIKQAAEALAAIDVAAALASLAVERDYVRPEVDGSLAFAIAGGRHPVVEQALAERRRAVRRQRLRSLAAIPCPCE